jgi:ParB-like chromosome segregation protein Spo0J
METRKNSMNIKPLLKELKSLSVDDRVKALNEIRQQLHLISPFKNEPVDFVRWVKFDDIQANDYNPNNVAPPEMELLKISILEDGYTQPIVTFKDEENSKIEVVDGFHRNRVGKECEEIKQRIHGYLPVVNINDERNEKGDRIASTIRHNRARGKHQVEAMSQIVVDLKRRNWSDKKIAKELGMDSDEVLRLCQITGLAEMFKDSEFSKSWEAVILEDEDIEKEFSLPEEELEDSVIDG